MSNDPEYDAAASEVYARWILGGVAGAALCFGVTWFFPFYTSRALGDFLLTMFLFPLGAGLIVGGIAAGLAPTRRCTDVKVLLGFGIPFLVMLLMGVFLLIASQPQV